MTESPIAASLMEARGQIQKLVCLVVATAAKAAD